MWKFSIAFTRGDAPRKGRAGALPSANRIWLCASLAGCLSVAAPAGARPIGADLTLVGFNASVERKLKASGAPGVAVLVVQDGHVRLAKGYGFRDLSHRKPMTADTVFMLGSQTKAMTSVALGLLVDDGAITFDTPVQTLIPDFGLSDVAAGRLITVSDLVSHQTGLPPHDIVWYSQPDIRLGQLIDTISHLDMSAQPRKRWQYNNLMYGVAGRVIDVASGKPWREFLRSRLLRPLGMDAATLSLAGLLASPNHALPYARLDGDVVQVAYRSADQVGSAGGLNASMNTMGPWLEMLLDGGLFGNKEIISAETLRTIESPRIATGRAPNEPEATSPDYAMGFFVDRFRGEPRLLHTGSIDGFHSYLMLFPAWKLGILVASNLDGSVLPEIVGDELADRFLNKPRRDWAAWFRSKAAAIPTPVILAPKAPARALDAYAGVYQNAGYGRVTVSRGDGLLDVRLNSLRLVAVSAGGDAFVVRRPKGSAPGLLDGMRFDFAFEPAEGARAVTVMAALEPAVSPIRFRRGDYATLH